MVPDSFTLLKGISVTKQWPRGVVRWCFNLYPLKLLKGCKNLISAHGTQPEVLMAQEKHSTFILK